MAAKARDNWKQTGFTNMAGQQSPDFRQPLNTPAPYDAYTPRTTAPTAFVFPSKTCSGYLLLAIPKSAKNAETRRLRLIAQSPAANWVRQTQICGRNYAGVETIFRRSTGKSAENRPKTLGFGTVSGGKRFQLFYIVKQ